MSKTTNPPDASNTERAMTETEKRARRHEMNCPASVMGQEDECTCGLKWRDALQTEREMHNAWRKRAEEAEAALSRPSPEPTQAQPEIRFGPADRDPTTEEIKAGAAKILADIGERDSAFAAWWEQFGHKRIDAHKATAAAAFYAGTRNQCAALAAAAKGE